MTISRESWENYTLGDNQFVSNLFEKYHYDLLLIAFRIIHDDEKAKDIVSDIYTELIQKNIRSRQKLNLIYNPEGFIFNLVKLRSIDLLRKEAVQKKYQHYERSYVNESNFNELFESVFANDINYIKNYLTKRQREILDYHLSGLKNDEISDKLQISNQTVRNTLVNAKKILREKYNIFMK